MEKNKNLKQHNDGPTKGNHQPQNAPNHGNPTNTNKRNTQQSNIPPFAFSDKGANSHPADHGNNAWNHEKSWLDHWRFGAAVVAAVAAIFAAGFTGWQAWIAQDTAKHQLRAYVAVKPGPPMDIKPNIPLVQHIDIKNFGVSPAFNVRMQSGIGIVQFPFPSDFHINRDSRDSAGRQSIMTIFPTDEMHTTTAHHKLTEGEYTAIMEGRAARLRVFSELTYEDIYGATHCTHYCGFYAGGHLYACEQYNETDDSKNDMQC